MEMGTFKKLKEGEENSVGEADAKNGSEEPTNGESTNNETRRNSKDEEDKDEEDKDEEDKDEGEVEGEGNGSDGAIVAEDTKGKIENGENTEGEGENLVPAEMKDVESGIVPARAPTPTDKTILKFLVGFVIFLVFIIIIVAAAWPNERDKSTTAEAVGGNISGKLPTTSPLPNTTRLPTKTSESDQDQDYDRERPIISIFNEYDENNGHVTPTQRIPKSFDGVQENVTTFITSENETQSTVTTIAASTINPDVDLISTNGTNDTSKAKVILNEEQRTGHYGVAEPFFPITLLMNHSAKPCEDFYSYACGGMETLPYISEVDLDLENLKRISKELKKLNQNSHYRLREYKNFINSCENYKEVPMEERIQQARSILRTVGKVYTEEEWGGRDRNISYFTKLLGSLLSHHFSPLLDVLLDVDSMDSSKYVLKLTLPLNQPPFGDDKGKREYGATIDDFTKLKDTSYVSHVEDAIKSLKIFKNVCEVQKFLSDFECQILINVTDILPRPSEIKRAIAEREFKIMTLGDLERNFSFVPWTDLMTELTNVTLNDNTRVEVYFESYFKSLSELISRWDQRSLSNALIAMFAHDLYHGLVLDHNEWARHIYCLRVASYLMREETSALYTQSYGPEKLMGFQEKIKSMFETIIPTVKDEINHGNWFNNSSQRILALDRVNKMRLIADGGMSTFSNASYLNDMSQNHKTKSTYIEKAVSLLQRHRKNMYLSYNKNPSEQIWSLFLDPYSTTGLAVHPLNAIAIPYGMMQNPFFDERYSTNFQMARLGRFIAKEIYYLISTADGFKHKQLTNWLVPSIHECYHKPTSFGTMHVNDLQADYESTYLAYKSIWRNESHAEVEALQKQNFNTPEQLFFLAMAQNFCTKTVHDHSNSNFEDEHMSPFARINDISRHSTEFKKAFECSMVKREECIPPNTATTVSPRDGHKKEVSRCLSTKVNPECWSDPTTTTNTKAATTTTIAETTTTTTIAETTTTTTIAETTIGSTSPGLESTTEQTISTTYDHGPLAV